MTPPVLVSSLIFLGTLLIIFSDRMQRTIAAVLGSALMVGAGLLLDFYSEDQAIAAIDFHTLGLLLGMMLLVAMLQPTGFFEYLAIYAGRLSRGSPVRLLILLATITTLLSLFLDNVTTVVLIAPVTILISEVMGVNPIPYLISEALLSNTGGAGTLIGDPPNVLIGSAAGLSFNAFLTKSLPIVAVAWLAVLLLLLHLFRRELRRPATGAAAVMNLDPARALTDPPVARKVLVVLGVAIALFFVHNLLGLSPAFIALSAAAAALVLVRPELSALFARVEWSVLVFFMALFVMVGGLEAAGVLDRLGDLVLGNSMSNPIWFGVAIIWTVAILSAVVDNIPITIALIPVIQELGAGGVDIAPLWWALVFGAGFGGNGTIIGSTANVVVVSVSDRTRTPITAALWNRRGLPVMLLACAIASALFVLLYPWLAR